MLSESLLRCAPVQVVVLPVWRVLAILTGILRWMCTHDPGSCLGCSSLASVMKCTSSWMVSASLYGFGEW